MKKSILMAAVALTAACSAPQLLNPADVEEATTQVTRVEPLSWWTGMKTDLQLLIQGPDIASYEVSIPGGGLKVKQIHKADSPNFLFVDVEVSAQAAADTYYLVFTKDGQSFKYPYLIREREQGSADRESYSTADMIYLVMPDRFASAFQDNDEAWQGGEYFDVPPVPGPFPPRWTRWTGRTRWPVTAATSRA